MITVLVIKYIRVLKKRLHCKIKYVRKLLQEKL